ncbi:MAG: DUF3078 domain-containing protein [Chitinophagaceae bacterium]|nr:DUF3078 domain-containing protein [Chitinophagaceae bacterium]MBK9485233.1 DUF3078 domain-containing protein [Chitinophagaceae bacterium]
MIKPLILCLFLATAIFTAAAQDKTVKDLQKVAFKELKPLEKDGWAKAGTFIINVNQGALRNWAGGGEQNTLGFTTLLNYNLNHRKGKITWNNYFDIALGFQNASSFGRFRKIDDRIDITSKYGYQFSKKWYAAVLGNFNSQTLAGYNYTDTVNIKISNLLTPGKILLSAGIDFRPDKTFTLFVSPITSRFILKTDNDFYMVDKFGVPPNRKSYTELGSFATAKYTKKISPWAFYTGRLDLFSNYKRNPENVDLFFTNLVTMKFNKWLATNISVDMVYDDDVLQKTQLKEILGIGLTLKL